jgi:hypothetical protein
VRADIYGLAGEGEASKINELPMYGEKVIYGAGRGGWAFAKSC